MISTIFVYFLAFIISYFCLKWYQKHSKYRPNSKLNYPPCLSHLPIIGSLHLISDMKTMPEYFMKKSKELGNIIAFYACDKYIIVLNGRETIHEALVKNSFDFASRVPFFFTDAGFNPNGQGIIEHPYNEQFIKQHRICLNILKQFGFNQGIMETRITVEIEHLIQRIKDKNGQAFDPSFELIAAVSNVISSIIYGKRWSIDDPEFLEGIDIMNCLARKSEEVLITNFFPFLKHLPSLRKTYKIIHDAVNRWHIYVDKILREQLKEKTLESFCNIYFDEIKKLNNSINLNENELDQFKYTVRDLFAAGTETTATTLQWFIYYMVNNPNIQNQIRDELNRVVGNQRLPTLEDKKRLPILEATILELMRIKTLLPLAIPHLTLKDCTINGIFIPKDIIIFANIYSAHMDPDAWDEPKKFKIERFLSDDKENVINKNKVISFSLGKRSCLGEILAIQELFLFTSALIQQFQILPPEGQDEIEAKEVRSLTVSPSAFKARFVKIL